ncbi:MAG TPA: hypothetical protein DCQ26_03010 [Marinilabiliales bacterium]|nr:MAG: hypothetical protein A2W95_07890 [Bacteroidetes bacterium GWA2_40_14]OFX57745.1 MAG: hypothetical protein A2W84_08535 [Bacteroidetes bacterium GWC2_40_13]OFX73723.1 MAG: hypothetical protein A2W96_07810 [Bacteroidetes bacterium GWD2_40_43]OFX89280.1 MAG: hypothetical protein A2W97_13415 [Bacteroidetes bacterium GWE2_40_63]OFY23905.1 MAG: hypothetical protein A2W88_11995 [Bacteroidetes bacterium GWF2_40_13]OFZ32279.1 MAG: hypothetical protein A2437_19915 [Bacteroidetes bacterium RIFOXYC
MKTKLYLIFLVTLLWSCQKDNNNIEYPMGSIEFTISKPTLKSLKTIDTTEIQLNSVVVVIEDFGGNIIKNYEKIELLNLNGYYLSLPISLPVGNYKLSGFMVLDNNNNVVYISPKKDSPKAYLVEKPLPIEFEITKDNTVKIVPEVLNSENTIPEDFGYTTFSFDIVETFDFLMGVFVYNDDIQNFELTSADFKIYSDSILIYEFINSQQDNDTLSQIGSTYQITLPEKYNTFTIHVTKTGFKEIYQNYSKEELKKYLLSNENGPLILILEKDESISSLIAYYLFNGNALDYSGYENNGILEGALLSYDKQDSLGAYYFDGIDDFVEIQNSSSLNPISEITLTAWIKPESFEGKGNSGIISKGYYNHSNPYYQYQLGITGDQYAYRPGSFNFCLSINNNYEYLIGENIWTPNNWYFLVGTFDGEQMKLYVNSELIISKTIHGSIDTFPEHLFIGKSNNSDNYMRGTLDEIRIYNKSLTESEIVQLYIEN